MYENNILNNSIFDLKSKLTLSKLIEEELVLMPNQNCIDLKKN
jgi:hypothetical protein